MACSGSSVFDPVLKQCTCPQFNTYLVELDPATQTLLQAKRCDPCISQAYKGPPSRIVDTCQACSEEGQAYAQINKDYQCSCQFNDGYTKSNDQNSQCFLTTDVTNAALPAIDGTIFYYAVEQSDGTTAIYPFVSQTMKDNFLGAALGCKEYNDPQSC